jgi:hypothetical protein
MSEDATEVWGKLLEAEAAEIAPKSYSPPSRNMSEGRQ